MSEKCTHYWQPAEGGHACAECGQTCPTCNVCDGPTRSSLLVCQRCLDRCDEVVTGIEEALELYQPEPRSVVPAMRYDRDRRGGSTDHSLLRMPDGPEAVEAVMLDWVAMWTERSGDAQNVSAADYLRGHHLWAAHNVEASAWDDYRREMRQLRHRARRMAGLLPQRQEGPCVYCGGDVVRDWADQDWQPRTDGLADELHCTRCRVTWDSQEHWRFANRHTILALPQTHPDRLVTRDHARVIFPEVPAATWRKWAQRDLVRAEAVARWETMIKAGRIGPGPEPERMPIQSWDTRGLPLYRLSDLTSHVETWASDPRVQRRAG